MSSTNTDLIEIQRLTGNRHSIDVLAPLLAELIPVQQGKVSTELAEEIKKLLDGKQSNMVTLKDGSSARLMVINSPEGLRISPLRVEARLGLRNQIMGYQLSENDRYLLERHGHLGKVVTLVGPDKKPFRGLIGLNITNNTMTVLAVDKLKLPDWIGGVRFDEAEKKQLLSGMSVRRRNFVSKKGVGTQADETFAGFVRLDPALADTQLFHFERILPGHRQRTPRQQPGDAAQNIAIVSAPGNPKNPRSQTPLIDELNLRRPGVEGPQKGILQFDNATTALLIAPVGTDKFVVKINLPKSVQEDPKSQVFDLPVFLVKNDAETLVQIARQIDRAIGQQEPIGPVIDTLPEHIRLYLPPPSGPLSTQNRASTPNSEKKGVAGKQPTTTTPAVKPTRSEGDEPAAAAPKQKLKR